MRKLLCFFKGQTISPDVVGISSPSFPFPGEPASTSGSSTSSESSGDSGLPSNHDPSLFTFSQRQIPNGINASINPNSIPPHVRMENGIPSLSWEHSTLSITSPHSFIHPSPMPSTAAAQFPLIRHHQQLSVDPLRLPLSNPFNTLSQPTTPLEDSSRVTAQERTPVHTINHSRLKRGKEMGQVLLALLYAYKFLWCLNFADLKF